MELQTRGEFYRRLATPEEASTGNALQHHASVLHARHRTLAQSDHECFILFQKLQQVTDQQKAGVFCHADVDLLGCRIVTGWRSIIGIDAKC